MPIASFYRSAAHALRFLFAASLATAAAFAQSPSAADGFDPNVDGNVYALAAQPDGRLILGGQFGTLRPGIGFPAGRNNLARVNVDGSIDFSFDPNANGPIRSVVLQADGKILVGGDFTQIAGGARSRLARLNADGTLDATFNAGTISAVVNAILVLPDGRLVIGGAFTSITPTPTGPSFQRGRCARLSATGALDQAFNPNFNNIVFALALHGGGKVVVGGAFTSMQPTGANAPTGRGRLARLNLDGTPDSEFDGGADNSVYAIVVQRDGRIIIGGAFANVMPIPTPVPQGRSRLARLQPDGQFDSSFIAGASADVNALIVMPDGSVLAGGSFSTAFGGDVAPSGRSFLARFAADGTLDTTFSPGVNQVVSALALMPDGKFVAGGYFTRAASRGVPAGVVRNRVARFHGEGALDTTFAPEDAGRPLFSVVQPDGKILIAGTFTSVGGVTRNYLARLNADGTLDAAFNPIVNGGVHAIALQSDGKILLGGVFTSVGGATRNHVARLNANGTVDTAFDPNPDNTVEALLVQSDGKVLIGGAFTSMTPNGATTSTIRLHLARVNTDGTLDTTFDPGANNTVLVLVLQSDGKILAGGAFTAFSPNSGTTVARSHLARLNAEGTLDSTFTPSPNGAVTTLALQSDGKMVVGGSFTSFPIPGVAVTATVTTYPRNRIARVNADGTIDTTFDPNANGVLNTVAVQADGKILLGGGFTTLTPNGTDPTKWTQRRYVARVNADGTVDSTFDLGLNEQAGNNVTSLRVLSDGRILMCGGFTSLQPIGSTSRIARSHFVRLNANGTLDAVFNPAAGGAATGTINALAVQADGRIVVAGAFTDLGGAGTSNIARFTPEGIVDSTFSRATGADGTINAVALRPDTTGLTPQLPGFAWLNSTGTALAPGFVPSANVQLNGAITAFAFERDGSLLLAGTFTNVSNATGGNLIRLSPAGVLDTNFNPAVNGTVNLITVQNDGRIIIGGTFTTVNATTRNRVARLNRDSSLTSFDPNPNATVSAIIERPDGQILIAGGFTSLTPNLITNTTTTDSTATASDKNSTTTTNNADGSTTVTTITITGTTKTTTITTTKGGVTATRNYVALLTTDGDLSTGFDPSPNAPVNAMVLQADGKVVIGGSFTLVSPNVTTTSSTAGTAGTTTTTNPDGTKTTTTITVANGVTTTVTSTGFFRNYLARVNADGTLDRTYDPNPNATVYALTLQADGKVLIGGEFTKLGNTPRNNIGRINSDNGVDATFDPNANALVNLITLQSDGSILIGGRFTAVQPAGSTSVPRDGLARLTAAGQLDTRFDAVPNGPVSAVAARSDGTVILAGAFTELQPGGVMFVGGNFNFMGGLAVSGLASLNSDGSASSSFAPNPNGAVNALLIQPDGKLVVGGAFTQIAGVARNRIARFNADGSLDTAFAPAITGNVQSLALQSDGKILVGGNVSATTSIFILRLNANGSVDSTFNNSSIPPPGSGVYAIALQPDGKILVAAPGNVVGSPSVLQRLNADGSRDTTFTTDAATLPPSIKTITLQSDGRLVVVGGALVPSTDTPTTPRLVRVNATGAVDTTFAPTPDASVTAVALQSDGRVILGGAFKNVGGLARGGLARVAASGTAVQSMTVAGGTGGNRNLVWTRDGTSTELSSVRFDLSRDGRTWTTLTANGQRAASGRGWQTGTVVVPVDVPFYVRARGLVASGTGTSGVVEFTQQFNLSPSAGFAGTAAALVAGAVIDPVSGQALYVQTSSAGNGDFVAVGALGGAGDSGSNSGTVVPPVVTVNDPSARIANLSVRARVTTATPLITGFAISGTGSRTVLLRGVGPSLGAFGVTGPLAQPRLQLFDGSGKLILTNDGWAATSTNATEVSTASARTGAFPFAANSGNDTAVAVTLAPGAYSMQVQDRTGAGGIALAEIYDADTATTSKLVNISSRSTVLAGDGAFITGFVVTGGSKSLLVRGLGPALAQFGVTGTLADPIVGIYDASGRLVSTNDNWSNSTSDGIISVNTSALIAQSAQVSAFPLTVGSNDAALSITLAPGAYTVQVSGPAATATGAAMLEVYELP